MASRNPGAKSNSVTSLSRQMKSMKLAGNPGAKSKSVTSLIRQMNSMKLADSKRNRQPSNHSPRKLSRVLTPNGKRGNGHVHALPSNVWQIIAKHATIPPAVSKQLMANRAEGMFAILQPEHRQYIRAFANKQFQGAGLTNDQKSRLTKALSNLMIRRHIGYYKMPYVQKNVTIKQHYPNRQGEVGRFNISVNGIRLKQPLGGKEFLAPQFFYPQRGRPIVVGNDMSKAGWNRLFFEPYD